MNLKVSEIAEMCGGRLVGSGENTVTSFYTDSRETTPGKMFVPIRGENTDAHRFIPQVFASGAAATFSEEPLDAPAAMLSTLKIPAQHCKRSRNAIASASISRSSASRAA